LGGKRVLVTGADGFIGSHLTELLVNEGAQVRALALYNSFNFWGWLEDLSCLGDIEVITGDVRDAHFCHEAVRGIDVIFHLAALIPIPYSYRAPDSYVDTNIRGTLNLCQAARSAGVQKFIHTSTSEVYGTAQYVPIDEKHPLNPQSPYAATKVGADAIAASFHYSFGLPVMVARPFNAYGPRQSARAVIPAMLVQLLSGGGEIRLGNVDTTRDFTFVEDTCRGFVALASLDSGLGEAFHIGSNTEVSIRDIFHLITDLLSAPAAIVVDEERVRPAGSEVTRLRCDGTKLERASGFRPKTGLRQGLCRTIEWLRDSRNLLRYKERLYNV
jgi:NAD dependent epimerase/dehydratase